MQTSEVYGTSTAYLVHSDWKDYDSILYKISDLYVLFGMHRAHG